MNFFLFKLEYDGMSGGPVTIITSILSSRVARRHIRFFPLIFAISNMFISYQKQNHQLERCQILHTPPSGNFHKSKLINAESLDRSS